MNGVKAKVNIGTIQKYFGIDVLKEKQTGFIRLYQFKPDSEYDWLSIPLLSPWKITDIFS